MNHRMHIFVGLAGVPGFLMPVALAQKPPAPAPPPSTPPPSRAPNPPLGSVQPNQPREDLIMFLPGRFATSDGTAGPTDALVERVCNASVRQQVHVSFRGEFNMQLGSRTDTSLPVSLGLSLIADQSGKNSERAMP